MFWLVGVLDCNGVSCPTTGDDRPATLIAIVLLLLIGVGLAVVWRADKRSVSRQHPTAKPKSSDQAPGEEVVQVNDRYVGGGPPPSRPDSDLQHPTGG